ncbi:MAG TPA: asparaginase domain-containing protein [Acidobacteriota bacterium]|nr:asparaginase [Acidobacteriota bacterium]HOT01946.1 asparaginase domain-containing protein [Acidobacteriota bacterium]HQF87106.1 asparaginase domain-containing protein [Acidobacteriota bacterium]HQG91667.1 asparaginase domain-containing protein [Acidobacteriota bacterium]
MSQMHHINIVFTGGTIEKIYDEVQGGIDNIESWIDREFPPLRLPYVRLHSLRLMNIDSLQMTDEHRQVIAQTIQRLQEDGRPIVITHGTDTMVDTGRYIKSHLPQIKVPIVLTGAMLPLVVQNSDGIQNLTEALFATKFLPAGIHIVFHNEVYDVDRVRKNRQAKTFERIENSGQ